MKKITAAVFCAMLVLSATGCGNRPVEKVRTVESEYKIYYEMSDGTYMSDGNIYKYRLEISGRMPNASKDTTFVYLSNIENISFERAWKASGFSSFSGDYFDTDEAVLVECKAE